MVTNAIINDYYEKIKEISNLDISKEKKRKMFRKLKKEFKKETFKPEFTNEDIRRRYLRLLARIRGKASVNQYIEYATYPDRKILMEQRKKGRKNNENSDY